MVPPVAVALFFLLITCYNSSYAQEDRPCNVAYRCSTEENLLWATDMKSCEVFRNGCFLALRNCDLKNNYEPEFNEISKEKCQLLCTPECRDAKAPICGYYNDKKHTFGSRCEMERYVCRTGETYSLHRIGRCE